MKKREVDISQGKIWFGQLPDSWMYKPEKIIEAVLSSTPADMDSSRFICLKLHTPKFANNGVLGVRFEPAKHQTLTIQVGVGNTENPDRANTGLPDWLAEEVFQEAVSEVKQASFLGSGILRFECAGWDELSSTEFFFRYLTRTAIGLLNPVFEDATPEEISDLLLKIRAQMNKDWNVKHQQ